MRKLNTQLFCDCEDIVLTRGSDTDRFVVRCYVKMHVEYWIYILSNGCLKETIQVEPTLFLLQKSGNLIAFLQTKYLELPPRSGHVFSHYSCTHPHPICWLWCHASRIWFTNSNICTSLSLENFQAYCMLDKEIDVFIYIYHVLKINHGIIFIFLSLKRKNQFFYLYICFTIILNFPQLPHIIIMSIPFLYFLSTNLVKFLLLCC